MPAYPTPHIRATPQDFAPTVLMPGDPLRARFIAENYLTAPRLVNEVRGMLAYTGSFEGVPVSVMASGMGMPSMGIYSWELYTVFGVENILRVGTAGALQPDLRLFDIVLAMSACTDSRYAVQYRLPGVFAPTADWHMLQTAAACAAQRFPGERCRVGSVISTDVFYNDDSAVNGAWAKMGVLAVEMEAAALYMNAARAGKRALAVCSVSDQLISGEFATPEQRQTALGDMLELGLRTAVRL